MSHSDGVAVELPNDDVVFASRLVRRGSQLLLYFVLYLGMGPLHRACHGGRHRRPSLA